MNRNKIITNRYESAGRPAKRNEDTRKFVGRYLYYSNGVAEKTMVARKVLDESVAVENQNLLHAVFGVWLVIYLLNHQAPLFGELEPAAKEVGVGGFFSTDARNWSCKHQTDPRR